MKQHPFDRETVLLSLVLTNGAGEETMNFVAAICGASAGTSAQKPLLRNLSPATGLCNGTRLIVIRMLYKVIEARIIGGDYDGDIVLIPRISLTSQDSSAQLPFKIRRQQFPVKLAFSLSINKAQGQSVKWVGIDIRVPVFSHGQLYVALSRVTHNQNIRVLFSEDAFPSSLAVNVVDPEVLLSPHHLQRKFIS